MTVLKNGPSISKELQNFGQVKYKAITNLYKGYVLR